MNAFREYTEIIAKQHKPFSYKGYAKWLEGKLDSAQDDAEMHREWLEDSKRLRRWAIRLSYWPAIQLLYWRAALKAKARRLTARRG